METYPVYLGACPGYDVDKITSTIKTAVEKISLPKSITGKVVIKPNLVMAHPRVAPECYTRKEVIEGILRVIQEKGQRV